MHKFRIYIIIDELREDCPALKITQRNLKLELLKKKCLIEYGTEYDILPNQSLIFLILNIYYLLNLNNEKRRRDFATDNNERLKLPNA